MKRRSILIAALFVLHAGSSLALDLIGAYNQAAAHDPSYAAAQDALRAGREKAVQGRALLRPQVQLTSSLTQVQDRSSSSSSVPGGSDGSGRAYDAAIEARQPLIDGGSRATRKQLEQQTTLAELRFRDEQRSLMQRVAEAYFNVLLAEESLRVAHAEKAAVALQRDRAQARFDVGRGRITEVQEAQARYDGVVTRELQSESTLALRKAQLQALTGAPAEGLAGLRVGFAPQAPLPDSAEAWQQQAATGNARVLNREGELAIAGFEIDKYKFASRPTLDLVASTKYQGQSGQLSALTAPDGRRSTRIGLQFNVPLYAGGGIDSREREAVARRDQATQDLAAARRDARLQAQDAYLAVKTGVSRVGSLEQAVRSSQTALDATTLGRDVGTRTELDVLDAQQRLYASQLDLAQARNDYLLGRVRLAAAAGALEPADLQALNAYLAR